MTNPYRPLDPLTGKTMGLGSYTPSPGLQKRLDEPSQPRTTPEGTFKQGKHGMEFVPKGCISLQQIAEPQQAPAAFIPGDMVRITACVDAMWLQDPWPFDRKLAASIAGLIGCVDGPAEDGQGLYVEVNGRRVLLLPRNLRALTSAELKDALPPAEGDDEREAMGLPAQATLGVLSISEGQALFGHSVATYASDLGPADWVEVIDGPHAGKQGSVRYMRHGHPRINMADGGVLDTVRSNVRLITKAQF